MSSLPRSGSRIMWSSTERGTRVTCRSQNANSSVNVYHLAIDPTTQSSLLLERHEAEPRVPAAAPDRHVRPQRVRMVIRLRQIEPSPPRPPLGGGQPHLMNTSPPR